MIRLLLLEPEGQGLPDSFSAGDSPLAAEGIQLLSGLQSERNERILVEMFML